MNFANLSSTDYFYYATRINAKEKNSDNLSAPVIAAHHIMLMMLST